MGECPLILTIGGVSVEVNGEQATFIDELAQHYAIFRSEAAGPCAAHIYLEHATLDYRDTIRVMAENDKIVINGGEFKGVFCPETQTARFTMKAEASLFDSFLRVFYSLLLTQYDGFLVHAAGLAKNGKAYLFAGPSSSGKTTTARSARDGAVLNDELTLVRKIGDEFQLFATPFTGEYDGTITNLCAPLQGLFFLDKDLNTAYEPVGQTEGLTGIMANVFFFDSDPDANRKVLELCHQLVSRHEGYRINIRARQNLWEIIHDIQTKHCYS